MKMSSEPPIDNGPNGVEEYNDFMRGIELAELRRENADLRQQFAEANTINKRLIDRHAEIIATLYGQAFKVIGWHLNGDTATLDSWFEENGWLEAIVNTQERR
jgi:hypothetical protein